MLNIYRQYLTNIREKSIISLFNRLTYLIVFVLTANAFGTETQISHFRVLSANPHQAISIDATIDGGFSLPVTARVYYRNLPGETFEFEGMEISSYNISGEIPGEAVKESGIEYYIKVILQNEEILTYPVGAPHTSAPISVNVSSTDEAVATVTEARTVIISPDPDSRIDAGETLIAVSILPGSVPVDPSSLHILIDGKDVTNRAFVSEDIVSVIMPNLKFGIHKVHLYSKTGDKKQNLAVWTFEVSDPDEGKRLDFPVHIKTDAGYSYEDIHGENRDIAYLNARLNGKLNELFWASRLYFTSLENKNIQPQHRFNLALKYGGNRLMVGDVRPRFSEFSVWGVRARGAELKFDSKYFNLALTNGQVRRDIEGSELINIVIDPTSGDTLKSMVNPAQDSTSTRTIPGTYQRNLIAIRPGFGYGKNVVLSFNLVKVKDDLNSIEYGINPKDNLVMGFDLKITSPSRRFQFSTETALSMYNSNISSGSMTDANDYEDIIVVNQYFQPLSNDSTIIKGSFTNAELASKLLDEMISSSMAHRTTFAFNYFRNELRVGYKTIGNSFKSLASPSVLTDIAGLSIEDRIRLLNNRVYLNIGYEDYENNVNGRASTTMDRNIIRGGLSYYSPPQYPNANFTVRTYDRVNDGVLSVTHLLSGDSVVVDKRIEHNSSSYTFGIDQSFEFAEFTHTASAMFSSNIGSDKINSAQDTDMSSFNLNLISKRKPRLETRVGISNSKQQSLGGDSDLTYNTISVSGRYMILHKSFWAKAGITSSTTSGGVSDISPAPADPINNDIVVKANNIEFDRLQLSAGIEYRHNDHHQLRINGYWYGKSDGGFVEYYSGRKEANLNTLAGEDDLVARVNYSYIF